jgi:hypothetical protein
MHGTYNGEDDCLHVADMKVSGVEMKLGMTVDPATGATDGPWLLVGSAELTPRQARVLGEALVRLADLAGSD